MGTFDKCPRPNLKFAKLLISFVGNICKDYLKAQTICNSEKLRISYIKPEKIPGNIFFDISKVRKSSRRGLFGQIFHKLRIQGRMQIFEKKSQSALNHVLIG